MAVFSSTASSSQAITQAFRAALLVHLQDAVEVHSLGTEALRPLRALSSLLTSMAVKPPRPEGRVRLSSLPVF